MYSLLVSIGSPMMSVHLYFWSPGLMYTHVRIQFYYWVFCYANLPLQHLCISCTAKGRENENLITCYIRFQELIIKEGPLSYSTSAHSRTVHDTPEVWWNPVTVAYFVRTSTHHCDVDIGSNLRLRMYEMYFRDRFHFNYEEF
jgi:hypothetical protein